MTKTRARRQHLTALAALAPACAAVLGLAPAQAAVSARPVALAPTSTSAAQATDDGSADLMADQGPVEGGYFAVRCTFVRSPTAPARPKIAEIDPILAPGRPAAHDHVFFGNARTTSSPLDTDDGPPMERRRDGELQDTTCENSRDTASYWFPAMYELDDAGVPRSMLRAGTSLTTTTNVRAYYVNAVPQYDPYHREVVQHVPNGLMMVSGFPHASLASPPDSAQQRQQVFWDCGTMDGVLTPRSRWPYRCQSEYRQVQPDGTTKAFRPDGQVAHVLYPYCWDPRKRYSSNAGTGGGPQGQPVFASPGVRAASHTTLGADDLAFPARNGVCARDRVYIPKISLRLQTLDMDPCGGATPCCPSTVAGCEATPRNVRYRFADASGAMGSFYSLHADYWNTWKQGAARPDTAARHGDGTLNSLTARCLNRNVKCSFVPDTQPYP